MSLYTRILVATDFSDINRVAVERAAVLAKQNECQLTLLHVIEHFPIDGGPLSSVFKNNAGPDDGHRHPISPFRHGNFTRSLATTVVGDGRDRITLDANRILCCRSSGGDR